VVDIRKNLRNPDSRIKTQAARDLPGRTHEGLIRGLGVPYPVHVAAKRVGRGLRHGRKSKALQAKMSTADRPCKLGLTDVAISGNMCSAVLGIVRCA